MHYGKSTDAAPRVHKIEIQKSSGQWNVVSTGVGTGDHFPLHVVLPVEILLASAPLAPQLPRPLVTASLVSAPGPDPISPLLRAALIIFPSQGRRKDTTVSHGSAVLDTLHVSIPTV